VQTVLKKKLTNHADERANRTLFTRYLELWTWLMVGCLFTVCTKR